MKVAFTTIGNDLNALMDSRFGRAPKFIIYDLDKAAFEVIDNTQNLNAAQGAGIQSAETIVRSGAKSLVTGHCGPKAFRVLSEAGVTVYTTESGKVSEALDLFRKGALHPVKSADVDGHWV